MKKLYGIVLCLLASAELFEFSCSNRNDAGSDAEIQKKTPVTVTSVITGPMTDYILLTAISQYLQKDMVKATTNGYVQEMKITVGSQVYKGQILFILKTKEATVLGNTLSELDSSYHFSGVMNVVAPANGLISQLNHQTGDYVQDGEQLAVINDASSFVFILNVPYELKPFLANSKSFMVSLPDSTILYGELAYSLPVLDVASQTEQYAIKVKGRHYVPENLIAQVKLVRQTRNVTTSVPKECLLTDETQDHFWVMKMVNDSTAVRVEAKKGIETGKTVEILSPSFSSEDRILLTGNYGLRDTAKVEIVK